MSFLTNLLAKTAANYLQAKVLGADTAPKDILKYTLLQEGLGALGSGGGLNLFGGGAKDAQSSGIAQAESANAIASAVDKKMGADNAPVASSKNLMTTNALARPSGITPFKQADNTLGYAKFLTDAGILGADSKIANLLNSPVGEALATMLVSGIGSKMFDQEDQVGPPVTPFGGTEGYTRLNVPRRYEGGGMIDGQYFPRRNGGIMPHEGSGQKDDVPAMLMAGEFVLTKNAVKGLGNGDSKKGIEKAYSMMRTLENKANNYV